VFDVSDESWRGLSHDGEGVGTSRADVVLTRMQELRIDLVSVSGELVLQTHRISYADAFAAGLAMELRCPLVTGDPEFLALAKSGIIELDWIGA